MNNNLYTIGVEEEYMICDAAGNLIDKADFIMNIVKDEYPNRFSYELLLSEIESNTSINNTLDESVAEVIKYRNVLKTIGEKSKVSIRNIRREANDEIKKLLKSKEISEDDEKKFEKLIQTSTDNHIKKVDDKVISKEEEIMKI